MKAHEISRATLSRIPIYLKYLKALAEETETISATTISKGLSLGEVQVRKDLNVLSGAGKPKIGYLTAELIDSLDEFITRSKTGAIIVGSGKLGAALLDYDGLADFGIDIMALFDCSAANQQESGNGEIKIHREKDFIPCEKKIYPLNELSSFCRNCSVQIGIIATPAPLAQEMCDRLIAENIAAILSFAPCALSVPQGIPLHYENPALSLAYLREQIKPTP